MLLLLLCPISVAQAEVGGDARKVYPRAMLLTIVRQRCRWPAAASADRVVAPQLSADFCSQPIK